MATAEVRSYLERHRINKLFEDLMSNIVKDQPPDPVAFLITVLRSKQGKKSPSSRMVTPTVSSTLKGRGGLQVKGAAVEAGKQATGSRLTKSSADVRPSSASAPRRTPLASASTPNVTSRPATSVGREGAAKSPRKSPGQAKPATKITTTRAQPPVKPSVKSPASKTRETTQQKKTAEKSAKKQADGKQVVGKPPSTPTRQCSILDESPSLPHNIGEDAVDEFFGGKSAYSQDFSSSEDEDASLEHIAQDGQREGSGQGISLDGVDDEVMTAYKNYRQFKQSHHGNKSHLVQQLSDKMADTVQVAADSSGYNSSGEEDSEDSEGTTLELYECPGDLLEEGIECSAASSHSVHRTADKPNQGDVLIKVAICAKCARAITAGDEEATDVTSRSAASTSGQEELFDSASQVGSNVSYPQWDLEGGPKMSLVQMWGVSPRGGAGNDQSDDGSTVVSQQTADSWGGLAPPHRNMPYAPSETGSESAVTAPLEGTPWGKTATEGTLAQRWASK